jgi:hypothetical protein
MVTVVGDMRVYGGIVLRIHGDNGKVLLKDLMHAVHLAVERTFVQDLCLLVDVAIKAL